MEKRTRTQGHEERVLGPLLRGNAAQKSLIIFWASQPPLGRAILLIDDFCGRFPSKPEVSLNHIFHRRSDSPSPQSAGPHQHSGSACPCDPRAPPANPCPIPPITPQSPAHVYLFYSLFLPPSPPSLPVCFPFPQATTSIIHAHSSCPPRPRPRPPASPRHGTTVPVEPSESASPSSSPSPSKSRISSVSPALSSTHATRRPARPFTDSVTAPSVHPAKPRD